MLITLMHAHALTVSKLRPSLLSVSTPAELVLNLREELRQVGSWEAVQGRLVEAWCICEQASSHLQEGHIPRGVLAASNGRDLRSGWSCQSLNSSGPVQVVAASGMLPEASALPSEAA